MRVFVLALDGLEYLLVRKWGLSNLMQKRYGYFEVLEEYFHRGERVFAPYTPKIWASLITGKKPSEHGIRSWWTYGRLLDRLRYFPLIKKMRGKRRILWKLGLKPRIVDRRDLKGPTIFDVVRPSVAVNVMAYNEKAEYRRRPVEAFYRGRREYEREIWRIHEERKRDTLSALEEHRDWKLFMTYFDLADWAGHFYRGSHPLRLMRAYLELDRLAGELQERVPPGTVFLIISDHGMEPSGDSVTGVHSRRAFWSLNIDEEWEPRDFVDFFPKIVEWCRDP